MSNINTFEFNVNGIKYNGHNISKQYYEQLMKQTEISRKKTGIAIWTLILFSFCFLFVCFICFIYCMYSFFSI